MRGKDRGFDVCVFGAGPAGIAIALRLADAGAHVAILDHPTGDPPWVGETFSGAIRAAKSKAFTRHRLDCRGRTIKTTPNAAAMKRTTAVEAQRRDRAEATPRTRLEELKASAYATSSAVSTELSHPAIPVISMTVDDRTLPVWTAQLQKGPVVRRLPHTGWLTLAGRDKMREDRRNNIISPACSATSSML